MAEVIGQLLVTGVLLGLMYGVIAVCIGIIYNATQIINFAQGEFVMIGGVAAWVLITELHAPLWLAGVAAVAIGAAMGLIIERLVINTARRFRPPLLTYIFLTFGVSIILSNLTMFAFGTNPLIFDPFLGRAPIVFEKISTSSQYALLLPLCLVLLAGLTFFFAYTRYGKSMRAAAVNEFGAKIVGIDVGVLSMMAFALSGAVSALVGFFLTPITTTSYSIGLAFTLKGFAAAITGGLGDFRGAVVGGLIIGIVESLGAGLVSSQFQDAITFLFVIVMLVVLPKGIFASMVEERDRL
ncbi:branched-chain amino acid ABC transporter permease [bacterium]|nr:MAG: branched-chain amino acid ABC transporter permease [bacterium]